MKKTIVSVSLYFFVFAAVCQSSPAEIYADSLLNIAENAHSDSLKINGYLELSDFWSDRDTTIAFQYLDIASGLMPAGDKYYEGLVHFYTAGIYFDKVIERGKNEYLEAEQLLKTLDSKAAYRLRARLWNNYGALLQRQDQQDGYIKILLNQAIPMAKMAGDSIIVATNYQNVALVLMNITDYDRADEYYHKAIQALSGFSNAHEEKLTAFVNAAKNGIYSRKFKQAKVYLDSAEVQLNFIPHSLYAPVFYMTSGNYFRHQKMWDESLQMLDTGHRLANEYNDHRSIAAILFEKYNLYKDLGDIKNAKLILMESYRLVNRFDSLHDKKLHLKELSIIDAQLNDFPAAYRWLNEYVIISDSMMQMDSQLKILELEKKYRTVERENEILKLKTDNQQQQLILKESKLVLVLLISVLLIVLIIAVFGWKLYKNNKKTIKQNKLIHQQELRAIKQSGQLTAYNAMLQGQDQERNRIARDLHDGLGGMLAGVKLKLSSIVSNEKQNNSLIQPDMEIYKVIGQLDQSVDELRRIARNMMPESLIYMGLEAALSDLCKSLDSEKTAVVFEAFNLGSNYEQAFQISVYRIVQELLTNALKHANAQSIMVQCSENEDRLYITVEDDGKGFDQNLMEKNTGIGLSNIKNRVQLLQGSVEINSKPNEGTTFSIEIPCSL
ncbi:sensor histidine kinase [Anditalea andensis]|uniref:Oxygen sensor histidine kinase NreB n=1 Tax=Anditalea andensis TaxID=1048983 RepID=A0A074KWB8_9BACT|nr:sensor histidine kinase [Anditalea andensis]KEO71908.1 hypothetical protein EL17_20545 [Anditalea andensis]